MQLIFPVLLILGTLPPMLAQTSAVPPLAAPLPKPLFVTHYDEASGPYVFTDRRADLRRVRPAFNAVLVSAPAFVKGDIDLVVAAREEGLAPILDFDYKSDFGAGRDIAPRIDALIRQVQTHPGKVAGIWVADQLNKPGLTPDQMLGYLAATGGEFHKRLPGMPVFVDLDSWEITCGRPQQPRCSSLADTKWANQVNSLLLRIYRSGYLDGMFLANNLKHNNREAAGQGYALARKLLPAPFLVIARSSHLSFPQDSFAASGQNADELADAYVTAPMEAGIDGIDLWAWHRPWRNESGIMELRTFLNKDGGENELWQRLIRAVRGTSRAEVPKRPI